VARSCKGKETGMFQGCNGEIVQRRGSENVPRAREQDCSRGGGARLFLGREGEKEQGSKNVQRV
jgi:hypothetical protein